MIWWVRSIKIRAGLRVTSSIFSFFSYVIGYVSISAFASLGYVHVGITSSVVGLKIKA